jgi:hypothetical protein
MAGLAPGSVDLLFTAFETFLIHIFLVFSNTYIIFGPQYVAYTHVIFLVWMGKASRIGRIGLGILISHSYPWSTY